MSGNSKWRRWAASLVALLLLGSVGCVSTVDAEGRATGASSFLSTPILVHSMQDRVLDDDFIDHDGFRGERRQGLAWGLAVPIFVNPEFDLRDLDDEEWDTAERYELQLIYDFDRDIQVQPICRAFLYYENKRWDEGAASVRHESFGIGFEAGTLLYPISTEEQEGFDFAFYPFLRFGIGTNQGKFRNIPEQTAPPPGVGSGDVGDFRVEGGLGIGARAQLGSRVRIGGSVGVQWWDALETGLVTVRDGVGTVVIDRDDTSFDGRDVFLRFGVEIAY